MRFIRSERTAGVALIFCTIVSLLLANSSFGSEYINLWNKQLGIHTLTEWVNDGLMVVFFFLVGLELLQEIHEGELAHFKTAVLPIVGALGGMLVPALIYLFFNYGLDSQSGFGIPMATDIAFALGALTLLGKRVPLSLKIFLTALAVIDDMGAILVIAIFYSTSLSFLHLGIALAIFVILLLLNKKFHVNNFIPYLIGGIFMWYFMLNSGIHATIAGVLLAITIPLKKGDKRTMSRQIQYYLHYPVSHVILPIFALANTAIMLEGNWDAAIGEPFAIGIMAGLIIGKPLGITLFTLAAVKCRLAQLGEGVQWKHMVGVGMLGGIGFTMSIFITLLAFEGNAHYVNDAKLFILLSSLTSAVLGYTWLNSTLKEKKKPPTPRKINKFE